MKSFREYLREAEAKSKCVEKEETPEYKEYFKKILAKYNVEDPSELSKEDKAKFFDEVDAGWKGEDEKDSDVNEETFNLTKVIMFLEKMLETQKIDNTKLKMAIDTIKKLS